MNGVRCTNTKIICEHRSELFKRRFIDQLYEKLQDGLIKEQEKITRFRQEQIIKDKL